MFDLARLLSLLAVSGIALWMAIITSVSRESYKTSILPRDNICLLGSVTQMSPLAPS